MNLLAATLANLHGEIPPLPAGQAVFYNSDTYRAAPSAKPSEPAQPARRARDHMLAQRQHNECRVIAAISQGIGQQIKIARLLKLSPSTISIICLWIMRIMFAGAAQELREKKLREQSQSA